MSRTLMLVLSNPAPDGEDEYNAWYDTVHMPEMLATDGVLSGRRFRFSEETSRAASEHRYPRSTRSRARPRRRSRSWRAGPR